MQLTSRDIHDISGLTMDRINKLNSEGWFQLEYEPTTSGIRRYTRSEAAGLMIMHSLCEIGFSIRKASILVEKMRGDLDKGAKVLSYSVGATKIVIDLTDIYSRIDKHLKRRH